MKEWERESIREPEERERVSFREQETHWEREGETEGVRVSCLLPLTS